MSEEEDRVRSSLSQGGPRGIFLSAPPPAKYPKTGEVTTDEESPESAAERLAQAEAAIRQVREMCEQARVAMATGCRCYTDECSETCGAGRALAWDLNPEDVLRELEAIPND